MDKYGKCKYCGQDAGFFKSAHYECKLKHENGIEQLRDLALVCFDSKKDFYLEDRKAKEISTRSYLTVKDIEDAYCSALDITVDKNLEDGIIDQYEEQMVARFMQFTGLSQKVLNRNSSLEKVVQSKILYEIFKGQKPTPRITVEGAFPFLLSKDESLVWLFRNITLFEQKVRREYRGRSSGMSLRIAKGVYHRTVGFCGSPIETNYMQKIDTGSVGLTDINLYFASLGKSLKIPYNKILRLESYSNGIGIQKERATAKPIFLEGVNSWFTYNVIANLKK